MRNDTPNGQEGNASDDQDIRAELLGGDAERWTNGFRPSYDPDWGDGQIHLDGEKDFPADMAGDEVAEMLAERCEVVGGFVDHRPAAGVFGVTAQFGALRYYCHYGEAGEPVHKIEFAEDGRDGRFEYTVAELKAAGEVARELMDAVESVEIVGSDR